MQNRSKWAACAAAAVLVLGVATHASATTFTLQELTNGSQPSFESGNMSLRFSDFHATVSGQLSTDLNDYVVVTLEDGWRLVGPIGVADGNLGAIAISYKTSSTSEQRIKFAQLFFNGAAFGGGSAATVTENFSIGGEEIAALFVAVTGGGLMNRTASTMFDDPMLSMVTTLKGIQVVTTDLATVASISVVDQRFAVPEPSSLALLSAGFIGLVIDSRRRSRN
ncbi:MAG: PEP-CTERM sorting domain-containing protein [Myxococcota bacterium]